MWNHGLCMQLLRSLPSHQSQPGVAPPFTWVLAFGFSGFAAPAVIERQIGLENQNLSSNM